MTRETRIAKFSTKPANTKVLSDSEEALSIIRCAKISASRSVKPFATAINALRPILLSQEQDNAFRELRGFDMTMGVDIHYRMYTTTKFVHRMIAEAKAISNELPCRSCGATKHDDLAYISGTIVHEAYHLIRRHAKRFDNLNLFDKDKWNIAGDLEINDDINTILKNTKNKQGSKSCLPGWVLLPAWIRERPENHDLWTTHPKFVEGNAALMLTKVSQDSRLLDEFFTTLSDRDKTLFNDYLVVEEHGKDVWRKFDDNKTALEYYQLWPDNKNKMDVGSSAHGSGANGNKEVYELGSPTKDNPGLNEAECTIVSQKVAKDIINAAKNAGNMPSNVLRWAEDEVAPAKYDWRATLRGACRGAVLSNRGTQDRSFRRLGLLTHSIGGKAIFPAYFDQKPNVTIVFDTSGSMDEKTLKSGAAETIGVMKTLGSSIRLTSVDSEATDLCNIGSVRDLKLTGGGGTDMCVGITAALNDKVRPPSVIIVITDGYTPWPNEPLNNNSVKLVCCVIGNDKSILDLVPSWATKVWIEQEQTN